MKDYEILSRATAFLMQVDPPDNSSNEQASQSTSSSHDHQGRVHKPAFPHLKENKDLRKKLLLKQDYAYDPAAGPPRLPHQLNWLEFCPTNFRPLVHVVSSSHVISPWLWPKYYGQDWLKVLKQEHVRYSLEVWGQPSTGGGKHKKTSGSMSNKEQQIITHDGKLQGDYQPLAKFALSPFPIHHPQEMDVALIHLKGEEEALRQLKSLGIQPLHLPSMYDMEMSNDATFQPGEKVLFQGFQVDESNATDQETLGSSGNDEASDDERVFHPFSSLGELTMASPDRFLARTNGGPIPEGLCGGPVIQMPKDMTTNGNNTQHPLTVRGVIEGIIPPTHENKELAGLASFIPFYRMREFVDFAERIMLEQIVEPGLFERIVRLKEQREQERSDAGTTYKSSADGGVREANGDEPDGAEDEEEVSDPNLRAVLEGTSEDGDDTPHLDAEYQKIVASLHEHHSPQEVDAILGTVAREQAEVLEIWEKEGGDIDAIIERVRRRTYEEKDRILKEIETEMMGREKGTVEEGEIVSSNDDEKK